MRYESQYLQHYGILGQRWGVRRFQNEDGSYTEEGKRRYGADKRPESGTWKKSDAEYLSDEELNRRNSRLQREKQYRDQTTPQWERDAGQTAKDALKRIFIGTAVTLAVAVMMKNYKKAQTWIGEQASHKLADLRQPKSMKNAISLAAKRYGGIGNKARPIFAERNARMSKFRKYSSGNG